MKNRPFWAAFLTVCLLVAIGAGALCEAAAPVELQGTVTAIGADGSAIVDITMQALTEAGYELGDVLSVIAGGTVCNLPLVESFADVNLGSMYACDSSNGLQLAVHSDSFTSITGCAIGDSVSIWMFEKAGYLSDYLARKMVYSMMRAPDYTDPDCWAYLGEGEDKAVDVFLVCPTVDMGDDGGTNLSLDDTALLERFLGALNMERGIYEESCRLYAPYYRQMSMNVYLSGYTQQSECFVRAYGDVSDAFDYYLANYNDGRPIVLAGFSQGAEMVLRLMKDYFGQEELNEQLVATYAIGWRVTAADLEESPHMVMAQSAEDTGVIISFNTETPWASRSLIVPEGTSTLGINPLSWSTDSLPASRELNLGACFTDYSGAIVKEIPQMTGAYLDPVRGTLKVTDVDESEYAPGFLVNSEGSYHIYDYQFFYRNLQENVNLRVQRYLQAQALENAA